MKNKDKNKKSELTDKSKSNPKDIGNSLSRDRTDTKLNKKQTPQGRTDNAQDNERPIFDL